jgi:hypothetical protein
MRSATATPTTMPAIAPPESGWVRLSWLPGIVVALELEFVRVEVGAEEVDELEDDEDEDDEMLLEDAIEEEAAVEDEAVADDEAVDEPSLEDAEDADNVGEAVVGNGKGIVLAPLETGLLEAAADSMLGTGMLKKTDPVAVSCGGNETDAGVIPADASDACTESMDSSFELRTSGASVGVVAFCSSEEI